MSDLYTVSYLGSAVLVNLWHGKIHVHIPPSAYERQFYVHGWNVDRIGSLSLRESLGLVRPWAGPENCPFDIMIPLWCLTLPCTVLTVWIWRARLRADHPVCARCGYNLTANVSGSCPECGTKCTHSINNQRVAHRFSGGGHESEFE